MCLHNPNSFPGEIKEGGKQSREEGSKKEEKNLEQPHSPMGKKTSLGHHFTLPIKVNFKLIIDLNTRPNYRFF